MNFPTDETDDVLMNSAQVRESLGGVSQMFIVRRLADDPDFPRPTYIRDRRYWQRGQIAAYKRIKAVTGVSGRKCKHGVAAREVA
jgi:hypothetical protein